MSVPQGLYRPVFPSVAGEELWMVSPAPCHSLSPLEVQSGITRLERPGLASLQIILYFGNLKHQRLRLVRRSEYYHPS